MRARMRTSAKEMITKSFIIDRDLSETVDRMADAEGISASTIYRRAIAEYLEKLGNKKTNNKQR